MTTTNRRRPQPLWKCWKQIANQVGSGKEIALFADFDGTLVRIRKNPDRAKLARKTKRLLARISKKGAVVGIVSGRRLADIRRRVGLRNIWYVGGHGYFLFSPSNRSFALAAPKHLNRIRSARRFLDRRLGNVPGIWLEPKRASVAVHYRDAPKQSEQIARRVVTEALSEYPGSYLLTGKKLLELLPDSGTDKSSAIEFILRRERENHTERRRVMFIGDDVTDESVFKKLPGISIAVGKKQRTAAKYYLQSPAEVRRFLARLDGRIT